VKLHLPATLASILALGMVCPGLAQNRHASTVSAERRAPQVPPSNALHLPTSPILPMTNPIAPMTTAPVQPFVRYEGPQGTPTVVVPPAKAHVGDRRRGRDDRDGSALIYVPYDYVIYEPPPVAPPIPGYLPGTDPGRLPSSEPPVVPSPTPAPVVPAPTYYPDSNIVITPAAPPLVVERPPLGTTRVEAIVRYGEPWGRVTMRGKDTLYFNGGLVLVFENDRVVEAR